MAWLGASFDHAQGTFEVLYDKEEVNDPYPMVGYADWQDLVREEEALPWMTRFYAVEDRLYNETGI